MQKVDKIFDKLKSRVFFTNKIDVNLENINVKVETVSSRCFTWINRLKLNCIYKKFTAFLKILT